MKEKQRIEQLQKRKEALLHIGELDKVQKKELVAIRFEIAWLEELIADKHKRAKLLLKQSNLGKRFSGRTFDNYAIEKQPEAYSNCLCYAKNLNKMSDGYNSLILYGDYGTGKTHLAAAIVNYAIENYGTLCLFDTWAGHLESIKASWSGDRDSLNRIKNVELLVIDDYGKDKPSDWNNEMLFEVVNHRYESNLPTIVTTNMTKEGFAHRVGEAVYSRLCETFVGCEFTGEDMRKRNVEI